MRPIYLAEDDFLKMERERLHRLSMGERKVCYTTREIYHTVIPGVMWKFYMQGKVATVSMWGDRTLTWDLVNNLVIAPDDRSDSYITCAIEQADV